MACNTCGENRFANAAQLDCHNRKNHAEFSCSCNKKFMDQQSLENHKRQQLRNMKEFSCSKCCRSFKSELSLYQHKRSLNHWSSGERDDVQIRLECVYCDDRCGRVFKSYSAYEDHKKYLLNKMDGQNGCRRKVNKFLKKYAQICSSRSENGLPGVSSYIFKHAILWASEKHPDPEYWHDSNIANCLIDCIDDVIRALDSGKLPNYFNTSENILKGKDPETLRALSNYLQEEREKLLHI